MREKKYCVDFDFATFRMKKSFPKLTDLKKLENLCFDFYEIFFC